MVEAAPNETSVPDDRFDSELIRLEDPPDSETTGPPARRRGPRIALAILAAAAIAAAAFLGPTLWRINQQRDATLAMPATVADFKRDDSEPAKGTASDLLTAMRAEIELDHSTAAIYTDPSTDPGKSVMLFGGTALLWSPERELDAVLGLIEDSGDKIRDLQTVEPGPLGGTMKCGATGSSDSPMAVCGWADHGSIALALFPGRSASDSEFLMRTLRSATLTR